MALPRRPSIPLPNMQHYSHDDSFEREPLEPSSRAHYESPRRSARGGSYREDYYSPGSSGAYNDVSPRPPVQTSYRRSRDQGHEQARSGPYGAYQHEGPPAPPRHGDNSWARSQSDESMGYAQQRQHQHRLSQPRVTPGADNFSDTAAGGMAGIAYGVAERNARESGLDAVHGSGQVPPPPSRTARAANSPYGLNPYDDPYGKLRLHLFHHKSHRLIVVLQLLAHIPTLVCVIRIVTSTAMIRIRAIRVQFAPAEMASV